MLDVAISLKVSKYPLGLTIDAADNLYGITIFGGTAGRGEVFKLSR